VLQMIPTWHTTAKTRLWVWLVFAIPVTTRNTNAVLQLHYNNKQVLSEVIWEQRVAIPHSTGPKWPTTKISRTKVTTHSQATLLSPWQS